MPSDESDRRRRFPLGHATTEDQLVDDPHPAFDRLRRLEPITWSPVVGGWLVTDRRLVITALLDPASFTVDDARFSTGQVVGPSMLSLDGDQHRRHRSPFVAPLRPTATRDRYSTAVGDAANHIVSELRPRGRAELRTELAGPLAVTVITRALGLVDTDDDDVLRWYRAIVSGVLDVSDGLPVGRAATDAVLSLRDRVVDTLGRRQPNSILSAAVEQSDLSDDEVFSNVAVLMFGAIETSEAMMANALFHLLTHADQRARVAADRSLLDRAIDESLRLEPAAAVVDRYATGHLTFGPPDQEAEIRKGDLVRLSLAAANRDLAVFAEPHRFDINRPNADAHLAFVQGPHACIGAHLARLETRAAIEAVLDLLPGIEPGAGTAPAGLIFRKPDRLTARWPV
ncbi:MAG: cytochrome P450 [Acidimicrobiales bacterium]